jgi:hypothetical protein
MESSKGVIADLERGLGKERVAQNSANLLGASVPDHAIGRILGRTPGAAPPFLVLAGQNQAAKLFRFADKL